MFNEQWPGLSWRIYAWTFDFDLLNFLLVNQLVIHLCLTLPTSKKDLHVERSSAHGETGKCPKALLVNNDESEEPAIISFLFGKGIQQEKVGDSFGILCAKKLKNKVAEDESTEKQLDINLEPRPPKDLANLKTEAFSGSIPLWKFKKLMEDGWLTREDLVKIPNVREVINPNRGNVIQFLATYKKRGLVNIKGLDLGDVRSIQDFETWAASKLGKLSLLVKENVSQRGTEYTCHKCGVTFGGRSLIKHHLCGAHALWMEQVGYEEDRLSPENCKRKFSCAVEGLCDPKLQIERAVLKDDVFCPTDGSPFKVKINSSKSEKVATPMKRKKPQSKNQDKTLFKKKCQQMESEKFPFYNVGQKTHDEGRRESACYCCGRLKLTLMKAL